MPLGGTNITGITFPKCAVGSWLKYTGVAHGCIPPPVGAEATLYDGAPRYANEEGDAVKAPGY